MILEQEKFVMIIPTVLKWLHIKFCWSQSTIPICILCAKVVESVANLSKMSFKFLEE